MNKIKKLIRYCKLKKKISNIKFKKVWLIISSISKKLAKGMQKGNKL